MESKRVVAIIDDDYRVLRALSSLLESVGYAVAVYHSAEEFLRNGAAAKANCVLSDIAMPGISGPDLRQILVRDNPNLPVILLTGREEFSILYNVDTDDPIHFFEKPFKVRKLLAAIASLIR